MGANSKGAPESAVQNADPGSAEQVSHDAGEAGAYDAVQDAWRHLTGKYLPAMIWIASRELERTGGGVVRGDEAADVVHELLTACYERDWLLRADPERGRFRDFLFAMTKNFTRNYVRHRLAKRRHPEGGLESLDAGTMRLRVDALPSTQRTNSADESDEMEQWVRCMLMAATERMRTRSPGNARAVEILIREGPLSTSELSLLLGTTHAKASLARHRGIRMLGEEIVREVRHTVANRNAYRAELSLIRPILDRYILRRFA